jgi:hypothetical protein
MENIQFKQNNEELNQTFLSEDYEIRRRQMIRKITNEHHEFFKKLFHEGENTSNKVTIEKAYQEIRLAVKRTKCRQAATKTMQKIILECNELYHW